MSGIISRMVFEVLGRPANHVEETLKSLVLAMKANAGVKIIEEKHHEPIKVEKAKDLFTSFVEVEAEFDSMDKLFGVVFNYFPANVEIISPRDLKLRNEELNELANSLIARLHHYDAVSKRLLNERTIIFNKLKEEGIDLNKLFGEKAEGKKDANQSKKKSGKKQKKKPKTS